MKKGLFIGLLCLISIFSWAQSQKINYQGVAVGANGKAIKNASVGLRLLVLDSLPSGSTLYTETQSASTDAAGQFSIYLGAGTATLGTFANIPWANGNDKFLKVEMDAQGGSNYQSMGTTQLVSVPFAMAAGSLREGAILYGNNGQKFQLEIDSTGPKWSALQSFSCGQNISYAGENYPTVKIGTQCWFSKNLNVGSMINGISEQTNNAVLEKYCYNNDPLNCSTYGGLYQWGEAVQYKNGASNLTSPNPAFANVVQGICPSGWHLPSDGDFCTLTTFLDFTVNCLVLGWTGVDAGGKMKSTSNLWLSPNNGATNISGFSALPGGYRATLGTASGIRNYTYFWSISEYANDRAKFIYMNNNSADINRLNLFKDNGFSIRCLQD